MPKLDLRDPEKFIPRELFEAYVGPGSADLLAYYDKAREKGNPMHASFNLLAILVLPAWFGLRRLWTVWATYTGLMALLPIVEHVLKTNFPTGTFIGVGVAMGLMARGFLVTSANADYLKLKRQGLGFDAIREALAGRARPSVPFAVVGGLGSVGVVVAVAVLAQAVFAPGGG